MKEVYFATIEFQDLSRKDGSLIILAEMLDFALHIKGLGFSQKPDYCYLRECLQRLLPEEGFSPDWIATPTSNENFRILLYKQWLSRRKHNSRSNSPLNASPCASVSPNKLSFVSSKPQFFQRTPKTFQNCWNTNSPGFSIRKVGKREGEMTKSNMQGPP